MEPFFKCDKVHESFEAKYQIRKNEASLRVVIQHHELALALCEAKTNIIRSKAILHYHLYISNSTPCIYCPYCNVYLSVNEFSRHVHVSVDDIDDPFDADEAKAAQRLLDKHKHHILPYTDSGELNKKEMDLWQAFSEKYLIFKNNAKKVDLTQATLLCEAKGQSGSKRKQAVKANSVLSEDELDSDSTSENDDDQQQHERSRPFELAELASFKEDIDLSEEE